jgi:hypothetical protein
MALRFSLFTPSDALVVGAATAVTGAIYRTPYDGLLGGAIGVTTGHSGMFHGPALGRSLAQLAPAACVETPARQWRPLAHPSLEKRFGELRVPSWLGACVHCRHRHRLGHPRQLLQALPYLLHPCSRASPYLVHLTAMDGGNARGL